MDASRLLDRSAGRRDSSLRLLPHDLLIKTGPFDQAEWNYRPILGLVQRTRFRIALELLGPRKYENLLEIGYGSGVFMPELARHSLFLAGLDTHDSSEVVATRLKQVGVAAKLTKGSSERIPFPESSFDAVVSVSAIEFASDLAASAAEVFRVLRPGGVAAIVLPGSSPLLDLGLRLLTGEKAADSYRNEDGTDRRILILRELLDRFRVERRILWPRGMQPKVYTGLRLVKSQGATGGH